MAGQDIEHMTRLGMVSQDLLLRVTVECGGCGKRLSSDERFTAHSVFHYTWVCIECKVICDRLVADSSISRGNVR